VPGANPAVRDYISRVESWFGTAGVGDGEFEPLTEVEEAALFGGSGKPPRNTQRSGE
jgi:hypothetical protein